MIVALDVGNTHIRLGVVRGGDVTSSRAAPTSADNLDSTLGALLAADGGSLDEVETLVVASVVPEVTSALADLAASYGFERLDADALVMPMPIRVDFPSGVGGDRLVNAFAALRLYGKPAIVVDLGTATTFDVVDADGTFVGGAIAPGVGLGLESLAQRTAQLPLVPLELPEHAIGRNTFEAIQSGAILGYVGLVDKLVSAITAELTLDGGSAPKVILTGTLSTREWAKAIDAVDAVDPLLTLRGLANLHDYVTAWDRMLQG